MRHQQTDELYVPYREYRVANTLVGRPVIIAEIRSQDAWGFYPMLLDTGADEIVLPAKLMEPLGIEQSDCVMIIH